MEAFRQYTPMDPEAEGTQAALIMHFVNQVAPDIRKKLQRLERLGEKRIQYLITVAERVYIFGRPLRKNKLRQQTFRPTIWRASC